MPFVINSERWPVVVIRFPPKITHEAIDAFYVDLERVYARGATPDGPFVSVNDLYRMNAAHALAPVRKYLAEKVDVLFSTYRSKRGEAIVTDSALVRGIATAHYWVRKEDAFQRAVFETVPEAVLWAERLLSGAK